MTDSVTVTRSGYAGTNCDGNTRAELQPDAGPCLVAVVQRGVEDPLVTGVGDDRAAVQTLLDADEAEPRLDELVETSREIRRGVHLPTLLRSPLRRCVISCLLKRALIRSPLTFWRE